MATVDLGIRALHTPGPNLAANNCRRAVGGQAFPQQAPNEFLVTTLMRSSVSNAPVPLRRLPRAGRLGGSSLRRAFLVSAA